MRKAVLPLLVALALSSVASAGPNDVLHQGKYYRDAVVREINGETVSISSRDGDANVPWSSLTPSMRKEHAADYLAQKRQAAQPGAPTAKAASSRQQQIEELRAMGLKMKVRIRQITDTGILGDAQYVATNTVQEMAEVPGSSLDKVKRKSPVERTYSSWQGLGYVFVKGPGKNLVDGDVWEGTVWPAGTYRYTAVTGAATTVRQFVGSVEEAIEITAASR